MCKICGGKTLIQRCGSDTVMTARVDGGELVIKATYNDCATVSTTSKLPIPMDYCFKCGKKIETKERDGMPRRRYDKPSQRLQIIENTVQSRNDFGYASGSSSYAITKKQLLEMLNGKCLALYDGKYISYVALEENE